MDAFKLAILAFIAGGIVLYIAKVSTVNSILISAVVCTIITVIAVVRYKADPPKAKKDNKPKGPTIQ